MHCANDVRRSLQPIVDFAAEQGYAVVGITHFAKNTGGNNTTERVIGSQEFATLARMVLVTAKEEESEWGEAIEGSSRSILSSVESEETEHSGKKIDEARNFLYKVLANGPIASHRSKWSLG